VLGLGRGEGITSTGPFGSGMLPFCGPRSSELILFLHPGPGPQMYWRQPNRAPHRF